MMPAPGDEADHGGRGEEGAEQAVGRQDPDQGERDRRHDHERRTERAEPGHDQDVDQHHHRAEGEAQVAEHLVGDLPLPVPLHGHVLGEERLAGHVTGDAAPVGQAHPVQRPVHAEDRVHRTLLLTGHVAGDVDHSLEILAVHEGRLGGRLHPDQLGERHQRAAAGPEPDPGQGVDPAPLVAGQPHEDRHVLLFGRQMRETRARPAERHPERVHHVLRRDAEQRRLLLVEHEAVAGLRILHVPVHVDHARRPLEDAEHPPRGVELGGPIVAVHLRHEGLQDRRARRDLGDLDARARGARDPRQHRAQPARDVVALDAPLSLGPEVHLDVGQVRSLPHRGK